MTMVHGMAGGIGEGKVDMSFNCSSSNDWETGLLAWSLVDVSGCVIAKKCCWLSTLARWACFVHRWQAWHVLKMTGERAGIQRADRASTNPFAQFKFRAIFFVAQGKNQREGEEKKNHMGNTLSWASSCERTILSSPMEKKKKEKQTRGSALHWKVSLQEKNSKEKLICDCGTVLPL